MVFAPTSRMRWQDALLLVIGVALIFAPAFTGEEAYLRGALVSRTLAMLLVFVSLWTLAGDDNFAPEVLNAALGSAFILAAFCTHCVDAHRTTSLVAGVIVITLSSWAAARDFANNSTNASRTRGIARTAFQSADGCSTRFAPYSANCRSDIGQAVGSQAPGDIATWSAATWN